MPIFAAASYSSISPFAPSSFFLSPRPFSESLQLAAIVIAPPFRAVKALSPLFAARSQLASLPVLSFSGENVGKAYLDLKVAPPETARAVVHRGLVTYRRNGRRGTASTLTRGEVRGGGRKPYEQKGTGRARRGSQRTPLRRGGGVIFGPKPRDWSIKINRKEKKLAMSTAISSAVAAADAFVVEDFDEEFAGGPKTTDFLAAMRRWGLDPKEKAMFLMTELSENVLRSSRNIGTLKMLTPRRLNVFDILGSKKLIFTRSAVDYLNFIYGDDRVNERDEDEEEEDDG